MINHFLKNYNSNVTANEEDDVNEIKNLLIKQIESRVRWRESIQYMIDNKVSKFIEIGPGKVLSGLVKRINKNVKILSINSEEDIEHNNNIMINFKNKKILITGATGGIGNEIVKKFIELGGNVLGTGTKDRKIRTCIKKKYQNIKVKKFDISDHLRNRRVYRTMFL